MVGCHAEGAPDAPVRARVEWLSNGRCNDLPGEMPVAMFRSAATARLAKASFRATCPSEATLSAFITKSWNSKQSKTGFIHLIKNGLLLMVLSYLGDEDRTRSEVCSS